jgi:hypothetical protein
VPICLTLRSARVGQRRNALAGGGEGKIGRAVLTIVVLAIAAVFGIIKSSKLSPSPLQAVDSATGLRTLRMSYAVEQRNRGRLEAATDRSDMGGNSVRAHAHLLEPESFGFDPARSHGADGGLSRPVAVAKSPVGIAFCW